MIEVYWICTTITLDKCLCLTVIRYRVFIMFVYIFSTHVITLCTPIDSCSSGKVISMGEGYLNRVASFELNRAYTIIRTLNSPCTDTTWFFEYFYGFLGFVVWGISGHFWGVYQSHYCASAVSFLFSFVYVIYLHIASYLYGKQIMSNWGQSCTYERFSFVNAWIALVSMSAAPWSLTVTFKR